MCAPLVVLGALVAAFFYALTRVVPGYLPAAESGPHSLPKIVAILPFLTRNPFLSSLALLVAGGMAFVLGPREEPARLTAWYLAGGLLLVLWGVILVLIPESCVTVETGAQP